MIISRQKMFARRDYEGLDKKAKEELKNARKIVAEHLNLVRNVNNSDINSYGINNRNNLHKKAVELFNNGHIKDVKEKLLKETNKRNLVKKGGKIALATGGVVAAGIGAKKLVDKKKAKKEEKK